MPYAAQDISHWFAEMYGDTAQIPQRAPLPASIDADVAIVGAGYTGLWTAYELLRTNPSMRVVVLEAKFAGYGPSGRNGGAAIAQITGSRAFWAKRGGRSGAIAMERAVQDGVDQIGSAVAREGIDCGFAKNGVLMLARSPLEAERLSADVAESHEWGFTDNDSRYLNQAEALSRINAKGLIGAKYAAHCASIDPGKLVRGLAEAVERLGGVIFEDTRVVAIEPHNAITERGTVTAKYVIRATEGYSGWINGHKRTIVPVHTTMIATEPINPGVWSEIGWENRETVLAEHPFLHLQHTTDHRITIGGDDPRVPYRWGSATSTDTRPARDLQQHYYSQLIRLFPTLQGIKVDHSWSGVFGAPRDWAPSVGVDHATGLGWAGGYVGEGIVPSNMAGRTLRDLILNLDTDMTALPWVRRHPRQWEPEPIRYLGSAAIFAGRRLGEAYEEKTGRSSAILQISNRLAGFTGGLG